MSNWNAKIYIKKKGSACTQIHSINQMNFHFKIDNKNKKKTYTKL